MRVVSRSLVVALALVASGGAARVASSADTSTSTVFQYFGGQEALHLLAQLVGDDDGDATGHVEVRLTGATEVLRGPPLVRLSGPRLAGSIFHLTPGARYDLRWVLEDPDNSGPIVSSWVPNSPMKASNPPPPPPTATHWHVDAALGSDTNAGTQAAPFATIQAGANAAQPGDVVHVLPGVYRERVLPPRDGSSTRPIVFLAEGPGVVIDGSDPALTRGAPWTEDAGAWWTPFAGQTIYVAVDDLRVYDYQSLADLREENGNIGVPGSIRGGFFVDAVAGRLYLVTPDHDDPALHDIHVAVRPSAFLLDGINDVVIDGFEMRYFGVTAAAGGVGVDLRNSYLNWIRNCSIHHVNEGIRCRGTSGGGNVIEGNVVRDTGVKDWPWDSVKGHTPEASGISQTGQGGNFIHHNRVEGTFNGIYSGSFTNASELVAENAEIHHNVLVDNGDDALELEGAQRCVSAWSNTIRGAYNAISISPVRTGPTWIFRNVIDGYTRHAVKVNNGPTGYVFLYHQTARPAAAFADAQALEPTLPFERLVSRNNIWEANRYVIEQADTAQAQPVDWDRDLLWTRDLEGVGRYVKWLDVRYDDQAALAASGTIEPSGLQVAPAYVDADGGDFTPVSGHAVVDAAELLVGINDLDFRGAAPDVGAVERDDGAAPLVTVLRSDLAAELPGGADATFANVTFPWLDPDAAIANAALADLLCYLVPAESRVLGVARAGDTVELDWRP